MLDALIQYWPQVSASVVVGSTIAFVGLGVIFHGTRYAKRWMYCRGATNESAVALAQLAIVASVLGAALLLIGFFSSILQPISDPSKAVGRSMLLGNVVGMAAYGIFQRKRSE
jgi:hypothetical protein